MATKTLSNRLLLEMGKGAVRFDTGTFMAVLMGTGFTYDPSTMHEYGDISGNELDTGNGYTQGDYDLTTATAWASSGAEASITWVDAEWTANEGDFGPVGAAVILQRDGGTLADSLIVGCIAFDSPYTVLDGTDLKIRDVGFTLTTGGS